MFLAAFLSAHLHFVTSDERVVVPDRSSDDQAVAAERLAYVPSQSLTPVSPEAHAEAASLAAGRLQTRSK